ncbi:MAG: cyclodeaminase/cyclohydrolase family protein [Candidatus Omnitrophica bacterium]|nr:cyclodeaminase/cyclohydrolase family protein [Candidatus Omnitrophota bacterium]
MKYLDAPLKKYLADLGSALPAPGGGSAAALTATVGVSLLLMAACYQQKKSVTGCVGEAASCRLMLKKLAHIRNRLERLIDLDVLVYMRLDAVIKMPRDDVRRRARLEKALKEAAEIPFMTADLSAQAAPYGLYLGRHGNKNLMTDVGSAMALLMSAFTAARFNAVINLVRIKDRPYARKKLARLTEMTMTIQRMTEKVFAITGDVIETKRTRGEEDARGRKR